QRLTSSLNCFASGIINEPSTSQRIVNQILGPTQWKYSLAYLGDIFIYFQTFEEGLLHLDDILRRLNQANFRLNVDKRNFAQQAIGYRVNSFSRNSKNGNWRILLDGNARL
ncbi:unnamed protein product, partial [Didymodactylos carnosus]